MRRVNLQAQHGLDDGESHRGGPRLRCARHRIQGGSFTHAARKAAEKLGQALWQLQQVGLGYLRLGQPATTLSGGEAQRLKIARELALGSKKSGRKLYIMDEPTTGLHLEDIRKLAQVFDRLVDAGHTLVLIEHNLDVIKLADWVVDLGPEAGDAGGEIVAVGRPEEVAAIAGSHTGEWLRTVLPDWNQASGLRRAAHAGKPAIATAAQRRRARAS